MMTTILQGPEDRVSPSLGAARQRLRRLARVAEWLALAAMVLVVIASLWLVTQPATLLEHLHRHVSNVPATPAPTMLYLAAVADLVPAALFALVLWNAATFFRRIKHTRILDARLPAVLGRIGRYSLLLALAGFIARPIVSTLITLDNPVGHRQVVVGFGTDEVAGLIVGLLMFAFALVMQEAIRLEEDMRGFV